MDFSSGNASLDSTSLWMSGMQQDNPGSRGNSPELEAALDRVLSGDAAAFEHIVRRHERRVLTLAWRLLGTMEDAEDAAQEVFLRAFRYLHRFDRRKAFEPWLVRMTVNVCRNTGRKRRRRGAVLVESDLPLEPSATPTAGRDPHAELQSSERRRMLYDALAALSEKERTAIVLRDIEGMTTAEVADLLGSSESTVRVQISMARLKLRKTFERMKRDVI